jgi:predicted TPR repeat methyltransferase
MLEDYQAELGAETGAAKKALGKALGMARDLADAARESDFLRLVGDIVEARQAQDTFATFREAGKALANPQLQRIGETGEPHHEQFLREANRLVQQMFVEHARGIEPGAEVRSTTRAEPPRL